MGDENIDKIIKLLEGNLTQLKGMEKGGSEYTKLTTSITEQINNISERSTQLNMHKQYSSEVNRLQKSLETVTKGNNETVPPDKTPKGLSGGLELYTNQTLSSIKGIKDAVMEGFQGTATATLTKEMLENAHSLESSVRRTSTSLGLSTVRGIELQDALANSVYEIKLMGGNTDEVLGAHKELNKVLGRSVSLTKEQAIEMSRILVATNLQESAVGQLVGHFELLYNGAENTADYVESVANSARAMGLNVNDVLDDITNNLKVSQTFNFKNGQAGLARMALEAKRVGIDLKAVQTLAEKIRFSPEASVDLVAQLQLLGGAAAELGDPFQLMYESRNDLEAFNKRIGKLTENVGVFNKETGLIDIGAEDLHRLQLIAKATDQDFGTLTESARKLARATQIKQTLNFEVDDDMASMIGSMANFDKVNKVWTMKVDDEVVNLSDLSEDRIKSLATSQKTSLEQAAKNTMTAEQQTDAWANAAKSLASELRVIGSAYIDSFKNEIPTVSKSLGEFTSTLKSLIVKGDVLPSAGSAYVAGKEHAQIVKGAVNTVVEKANSVITKIEQVTIDGSKNREPTKFNGEVKHTGELTVKGLGSFKLEGAEKTKFFDEILTHVAKNIDGRKKEVTGK